MYVVIYIFISANLSIANLYPAAFAFLAFPDGIRRFMPGFSDRRRLSLDTTPPHAMPPMFHTCPEIPVLPNSVANLTKFPLPLAVVALAGSNQLFGSASPAVGCGGATAPALLEVRRLCHMFFEHARTRTDANEHERTRTPLPVCQKRAKARGRRSRKRADCSVC